MPCASPAPLRDLVIPPDVLAALPARLATRYRVVPIAVVDHMIQIATADPSDVQALDELTLLLGRRVTALPAEDAAIEEAIQRHYGVGASAVASLLTTERDAPRSAGAAEEIPATTQQASVTAFVNQLIRSAVRDRATDIHLEPCDRRLQVRQRVDGVLYDVPTPPDLLALHPAIVSRIKVMARLDIAQKRLPQDGRVSVRLDSEALDLRVSILPTPFGESVDLRMLSSRMLYSLEQLGLDGDGLQQLLSLIQRPHGIIFVTGPTGSGKTTTLYACLSRLNTRAVKILTIEDPIEYHLPGITQLQVHPKIGLSFAQGLRSMLRHDPDIMMVGEVRDPETAEITIRSALTGHLVFSTLHTNDAAGGVTRLLDMGIEPYLVASSVLCFIAQRLVRVICPACREERAAPPWVVKEFPLAGTIPSRLAYGRGCTACNGTGSTGRTAIAECLVVTDQVRQLILQRASAQEIAQAAASMQTLRQDGWRKVLQGVTTPEEVLRVA